MSKMDNAGEEMEEEGERKEGRIVEGRGRKWDEHEDGRQNSLKYMIGGQPRISKHFDHPKTFRVFERRFKDTCYFQGC